MLIQRIATALALLTVLVAALVFFAPWGFVVLTVLFVAAGIAEWLMLVGLNRTSSVVLAAVGAVLIAALYLISPKEPGLLLSGLAGAGVVWAALAAVLLRTGHFVPVAGHRRAFAFLGVALPALCALAILSAYRDGLTFMVSILALVWAADIGAYFCGRAFGRHKLAPAISPGKTVEGAIGGVLAVWVVAVAATLFPPVRDSFFARLFAAWPSWLALLALALLVGMSIVGDLLESHLKRQAGVKDSSHLLPGHGGVLDRIDALLPVVPLALLLTRAL